ncbi:MAG: hypothetical protein GY838_11025 [bacterium]|nr:hypothetical protein [bacterium]
MPALFGVPREPAWPEPRIFRDWRLRALGMAILLVPFFVPIPVELRRHVLIATLGDRLHMVLLAGAALALYWRGPLRGRLLPAALAAAFLGGAIEILQELVGRTALFHDFVLDVMGIAMVVGWVVWRGHGRPAGILLVVGMLVVTGYQLRKLPSVMVAADRAAARFPVLEDCRSTVGAALWGTTDDIELIYVADGPDPCVRLTGGPPDRWPETTMRRFPHDWRGYEALELRVRHRSADRDSVPFGIRLDDFKSVRDGDWDWFAGNFVATSEWRTFVLPVAGQETRWQGRPLDLADMDKLTVFLDQPDTTMTLEFTDIRLR